MVHPLAVYTTSLPLPAKQRTRQEYILRTLMTLRIPYEKCDVSMDENGKRLWRRKTDRIAGREGTLPGYLVRGEWVGNFEDFEYAVEDGILPTFLKLHEKDELWEFENNPPPEEATTASSTEPSAAPPPPLSFPSTTSSDSPQPVLIQQKYAIRSAFSAPVGLNPKKKVLTEAEQKEKDETDAQREKRRKELAEQRALEKEQDDDLLVAAKGDEGKDVTEEDLDALLRELESM